MPEKTNTITVDERRNTTLDLEGFTGKSCEKAFDDLSSGDLVKVERKKSAYFTSHVTQQEKSQR